MQKSTVQTRLYWVLALGMITAPGLAACSGNVSSQQQNATGGQGGDGNTGVGGGAGSGGAVAQECSDVLPFSAAAVRLTERQFRNTIDHLFPFNVDIGDRYPASSLKFEFTNYVAANDVLYADLENILETAETIALQVVETDNLNQLLPCSPSGDGVACAREFLDGFLPRAYRRPVDGAEVDHLIDLYNTVRSDPEPLDFDLAIGAVLISVMQSPQFLYRVEIGEASGTDGVLQLDDFEVASRLSYLFWEGPPDDALMAKAADGALSSRDEIAAEAARLFDDPKARPAMARFFTEWMGANDITFEDRVDQRVADAFPQEFDRFVQRTVFDDDGDAAALVASDHSFVNRAMQEHYRMSVTTTDDNDWQWVELPPQYQGGVLSKAQVAAAHAHTGDTSVILRGKFIHERLVCVDLGLPPAGAAAMNPDLPPGSTQRERIEARAEIGLCRSCHRAIDWAGFGMEDLDQVGRFRTTYESNDTPVEGTGTLYALDGEPTFEGTAGLSGLLADNADTLGGCLTTQWYRYATGHEESTDEGKCHVGAMNKMFVDSGYNLRALLLSIARSDAMLFREEGN